MRRLSETFIPKIQFFWRYILPIIESYDIKYFSKIDIFKIFIVFKIDLQAKLLNLALFLSAKSSLFSTMWCNVDTYIIKQNIFK